MVKMEVSPELVILTRKQVLHRTVAEIAEKILSSESAQEVIRKGVLEKQIIKSIIFVVKDKSGYLVAQFKISIDWEKHTINATLPDGSHFKLAGKESIANQVLSVASEMAQLIDDVKKHYEANHIQYNYVYRDEIRADRDKTEAADRFLGLRDTEDKWASEGKLTWDFEVEYTPRALSELNISVRAKK